MHQLVLKNREGGIQACRRKINLFPFFSPSAFTKAEMPKHVIVSHLRPDPELWREYGSAHLDACPTWISDSSTDGSLIWRILQKHWHLFFLFFSFPVLSASNLFCKYARSCIFYGLMLCTKSAWKYHDPGSGGFSRSRSPVLGLCVSRVLIFVQLKPCAMSGVRDSFLTVFKRTFSSTCRIVTLKSNQHWIPCHHIYYMYRIKNHILKMAVSVLSIFFTWTEMCLHASFKH